MDEKKKVIWVTGSSFIDVDLPIVPRIAEIFDVIWLVIRQKDCWFSENDIRDVFDANAIDGKIYNINGRLRSFSSAKQFYKMCPYKKDSVGYYLCKLPWRSLFMAFYYNLVD